VDLSLPGSPKRKEMRIVHTEASLGWGGQEIRILSESAEFIARGHEVTIVADRQSTIASRAKEFGVPLYPCNLKAKRIRDLLSLRKALKSLRPDIVVCHSSTDHWLAALARLSLKHAPAIVRARHISAQISRRPTTSWLYRYGCEGCLTTSDSIKSAMIRRGLGSEQRIVSIPTGIDPPRRSLSKPQARLRLNIAEDRFVVSIVATLRSWKGHADLLEALTLLPYSDYLTLIIGDGPQRKTLEGLSVAHRLTNVVCFLGNRDDIYDLLATTDVFVLPSFANEGVPQAILQAMAVGLPIVSCPVGGIPEALEGYTNKILVPPRAPERLAEALASLRTEVDSRSLSSLGQRSPLLKYTKEQMYRRCLDLYQASIYRHGLV
jgi:glycosyltransferase involved in cell wall biosynthesis